MIWSLTGVVQNGSQTAQNYPDAPYRQPINVPQGSDGTMVVTCIYPSGGAVNLTNWTDLQLTVKNLYTDTGTAPIIRGGLIADAAGGIMHFPIVEADTLTSGLYVGPCQYDVWAYDDSGARQQLVPTSVFFVQETIGTPISPTPPAPQLNTRVITVIFSNDGSSGVTQTWSAFPILGTLTVLSSSSPVSLTGGDIPAGFAVTALSNGSITVTSTADWTGYITYTVENT